MKIDYRITFPITGRVNGKPKFFGTGFFIDHLGGFVTARHVLDEADIDEGTYFVILQLISDKTYQPRQVRHIYNHPDADISLGKPYNLEIDGKEFSNPIWDYVFDEPGINQKVSTLSYPNSVQQDVENNVWSFIPDYFEGTLIDIHERCPTMRITTKCFQTDMEIHSGSSGGPVFNEDGKVIGVNSVSFEVEKGEVPVGFITPLSFLKEIEIDSGEDKITFGELLFDQMNFEEE